jgi:hypothetical protein
MLKVEGHREQGYDGIMNCNGWESIKEYIEDIIIHRKEILSRLDVSKKLKNIKIQRRYDPVAKGTKLTDFKDKSQDEINEFLISNKLPELNLINDIYTTTIKEFKDEYAKTYVANVPLKINKSEFQDFNDKKMVENTIKNKYPYLKEYECRYTNPDQNAQRIDGIERSITNNKPYSHGKIASKVFYVVSYPDKDFVHITSYTDKKDFLSQCPNIDPTKAKYPPFHQEGDIVHYSKIKENANTCSNYYWKTPDEEWLYINSNKNIITISIIDLKDRSISESTDEVSNECKNETVNKFVANRCGNTNDKRIRITQKEIYSSYVSFVKDYCIGQIELKRKFFFKEFEKSYKQDPKKGKNIQGKNGCKGYNIDLKL